jgi:gamma-glutamylcyclotransferase (GGCT)/AIG2-like uncharacterized protein YtfP
MLLFVYGTLKKGHANHRFMGNSKFVDHATLEGYDMYTNGYYPYITKGEGKVTGEVWDVTDEDTLSSIRALEGGYDESEVFVFPVNLMEENIKASAYTFPRARENAYWTKVDSGVFTKTIN